MNKFIAILLGSCLLSGSASWGMCQAVGNFVQDNATRCCKAVLCAGIPLAYGCFNYVSAFKKSAKTKKLAEKVIRENESYREVALKHHQDLTLKENNLKIWFLTNYMVGWSTALFSKIFGARDPITIAGIGIIIAVSAMMDNICDLSCAADMYSGELQAMPQNHD